MRNLLAGLALAVLTACGGSDATGPEPAPTGTFALQSVNGGRLPYVVAQSGQNTVTVTSDKIFMADGGTWNESAFYTQVINGVTSQQVVGDQGTWLRSGNGITLYSTNSRTTAYSGTFSGGTMALGSPGFAFVFQR